MLMKRNYNNILVNQLNNIGDVLLATSGVAILKKAYPNAKITMLVVPRVAELLHNHPLVDEVIAFEYKSKQTSWHNMWEMVKFIRSKKFDLNVSFDYRLRPLLLAFLAGISVRVSGDYLYQNKPVWFRILFTERIPLYGQYVRFQQGEMFRQIARGVTGVMDNAEPVMPNPHSDSEQRVAELLSGANEKVVLYCVRGTHEGKNWPKEQFAAVMQALQARETSLRQYIIGAPGDAAYADEVIQAAQGCVVGNLCGKTRLADLPVLFDRAQLFITVDTGAMHIAATTKTPILALFLNTNCVQWGPDSNYAHVLVKESTLDQFGISSDLCKNCTFVPEIDTKDVICHANMVLFE